MRSLLFLYFINCFTGTLTAVFIQIKVFQAFPDLSINIIGAMSAFTGTMVGFCVFGYFASLFSLDAKQGFYYSFISYALGLFLISQVSTIFSVYVSLFVYGLGVGFFWLTLHTYELSETKDHERDFYSSLLQGGAQLISVIAPLFATVLIWISVSIFHSSSFTLLFAVSPFFYLLGFFCFKGIQEYKPEQIEFADIAHFLFERKNRIAQLYLGAGGSTHILAPTLLPIVLLFILGNELRVGIYSTFAAVLSTFLIVILGHYRNIGNRIFLFGVSAIGISGLTIYLGYSLTFTALIMFTVLGAILQPIMKISEHVVSLQTMENIGRSNKDFYATMILRDFSLWFWRMIVGFFLLFVCQFLPSTHDKLSLGLYLLATMVFLTFIGARVLVTKMGIKESH